MELARIEQAADIQAARVHGLGYVGKQALHAAAMVSETEQQLSNRSWASESRSTLYRTTSGDVDGPTPLFKRARYGHYAPEKLTEAEHDALRVAVTDGLDSLSREREAERGQLVTRQKRLLAEREKLLQAHYADAVPLDLLQREQKRISDALDHIEVRLAEASHQVDRIATALDDAMTLATNAQAMYRCAPDLIRWRNELDRSTSC